MTSKRILYLDHAADMGGAEYSLLELLCALQSSGDVLPTVATARDGRFAQRLQHEGIPLLPLDIPQAALHFEREQASNPLALLQQLWHWQKPLQQLIHACKTQPFNWIHSNTLKMHPLSCWVGARTNTPVIWHMRDIPTHRGNALRLLQLMSRVKAPEGIISISHAVQNSLQGVDARRFKQVVHNGLPGLTGMLPASNRSEVLSQLNLKPVRRYIVSVGYFIPWKGQDTLIQAFAKLAPLFPDVDLVLVGKPIFQFAQEADRLQLLSKQLRVAERVHFVGEQANIRAMLPAFDVFVCPSTNEPFGRVILEAMAAGIPIVATNAGGIPEIVRDGQEALLVPSGDSTAMAQAMVDVLDHPAAAKTRALEALTRVSDQFTLSGSAEKIRQYY